ncbi:MAG TPA: M50 family metallopeptidase, partial [Gaiellaceae bacterium]|nr:M50 family metallopeptidase [Gaiellaceae bacterium]
MIWLVVIVGLLLLIFVHELGHFTVSLLVGIRPRSFYLGFPPAIAKFKRNGIEYGIGAIPLGGFVRIPGMHRPAGHDLEAFLGPALREEPSLAPQMQRVRRSLDAGDLEGARSAYPELEQAVDAATLTPAARRSARRALRDVEEGTSSDAYWRQPTWKRVAAIAAGPAANVVVAFIIFFVVYLTGAPSATPSNEVGAIEANTPAAVAGLHVGDRVVAVNGKAATTFARVSTLIRGSGGKPITVTVRRNGSVVTLGPRATIRSGGRWIWGFVPAAKLISYPAGHSARRAIDDCWFVVTGTGKAIGNLFVGHERGQLTSTVGIVRVSAAALKVSFNWYLQILAFVSMSLALFNLLPFLPLDGGHIAFSIIERIRRRAVPREVYERA